MNRVRVLSLVAVVGLLLSGVSAQDRKEVRKGGQDQGQKLRAGQDQKHGHAHDAKAGGEALARMFMECAKECDACARLCELCSKHCANMVSRGKTEHLHTLATCQDCATICQAASSSSARLGPFAGLICQACAEACKRCGDACDKHKEDDVMRRCAEACYRCEKACREMVKHAHLEATGAPAP